MMSPMSQNSATADGWPTRWHLVHYGARAAGGCGLILMEDTAVEPRGRVSSAGLGLYEDDAVPKLREIVQFCREQGATVGIQLALGGRKALRDRQGRDVDLVAPSALAYSPDWAMPRALEEAEIGASVEAFAAAARRALAADFDLIEIHAAHGYLLHQFLSPISNQRGDGYGGSFEGRMRFLKEVIVAVRSVWPEGRPLFVRLSAADGLPGGLESSDVVRAAAAVAPLGVDLIDVAAGLLTSDAAAVSPKDQHATARLIRESVGIAVAAGSGIGSGEQADAAVRESTCDLVAIGRPLLQNPFWAINAATALGVKPPWPRQYLAAM
jgi:2,4-dienoyl-CoA reductase-like NADH-dependent reductase (Old Yellow Enzyme family)